MVAVEFVIVGPCGKFCWRRRADAAVEHQFEIGQKPKRRSKKANHTAVAPAQISPTSTQLVKSSKSSSRLTRIKFIAATMSPAIRNEANPRRRLPTSRAHRKAVAPQANPAARAP